MTTLTDASKTDLSGNSDSDSAGLRHAEDSAPRSAKILIISLFHPELVRGGAQQVCYELFEGLRQDGESEVVLLASVDATQPALYKTGARITGFDGRENQFVYLSADYDHFWHKCGSPLHIEAFIAFLETVRPDVVHFHHFFTLGIDLLSLTRKVLPQSRIIFTFHEFMAICQADGHMVRRTDRSLCTHASPVRCNQCFPTLRPEQFHMRKMWFMRHLGAVDVFTCPSRFMIEHYVDWGIPRAKIAHVTNGQKDYSHRHATTLNVGQKNRFGFFGQLVDVKGVHILLRAVAILRSQEFTDFTVDLNGANLHYASPLVRAEIEGFLAEEELRDDADRIVFNNGSYHIDQINSRMARVDWCIVPSIWWEIFGLVISEAWMFGKPVICSNVGGMAERVDNEVSGLHFELGDPKALATVIRRACTEDGLWERLSEAVPTPPTREEMVRGYKRVYGLVSTTK